MAKRRFRLHLSDVTWVSGSRKAIKTTEQVTLRDDRGNAVGSEIRFGYYDHAGVFQTVCRRRVVR
jgi:hypothetical protein